MGKQWGGVRGIFELLGLDDEAKRAVLRYGQPGLESEDEPAEYDIVMIRTSSSTVPYAEEKHSAELEPAS